MAREKTIDELCTMKEILEWAIKREETSYEFYIKAKERSRTPTEADLFDFLAREELAHKTALIQQVELIEAQADIDRALSFDVY